MTATGDPVGMISNPGSGHNRDQFDALRARIDRCSPIRHLVTREPRDIGPALQELSRRGIRVLAINGGDGTAAAVLGALLAERHFDSPPTIALLPGGTANMTAGDVGVRGPLRKAVERFCAWAEGERDTAGKLQQRSLLRLEQSGGPVRHGFFLGAGAVIHGTDYAHATLHSRGLRDDLSLALGTARTVWGVLRGDPRFNRPVAIDLSADGAESRRFDTLILAVSTLQRLSFGMRPFYGRGPGPIRVTVFEQGCRRFARTFYSIVRGRPGANAVPEAGYHSFNAAALDMTLHGRLNLDGELFNADGPVRLSAGGPLEFLTL